MMVNCKTYVMKRGSDCNIMFVNSCTEPKLLNKKCQWNERKYAVEASHCHAVGKDNHTHTDMYVLRIYTKDRYTGRLIPGSSLQFVYLRLIKTFL